MVNVVPNPKLLIFGNWTGISKFGLQKNYGWQKYTRTRMVLVFVLTFIIVTSPVVMNKRVSLNGLKESIIT